MGARRTNTTWIRRANVVLTHWRLMDRKERTDAARALGILSVLLLIFIPLSVVASLSILGTTVEDDTRGGAFLGGMVGSAFPLILGHSFFESFRFLPLLSAWAFIFSGVLLFLGCPQYQCGILGAALSVGSITFVIRDLRNGDLNPL